MKFKKGDIVINKYNGEIGYCLTFITKWKAFGLYRTPYEDPTMFINNYYEREFVKANKKNVKRILKKLKNKK